MANSKQAIATGVLLATLSATSSASIYNSGPQSGVTDFSTGFSVCASGDLAKPGRRAIQIEDGKIQPTTTNTFVRTKRNLSDLLENGGGITKPDGRQHIVIFRANVHGASPLKALENVETVSLLSAVSDIKDMTQEEKESLEKRLLLTGQSLIEFQDNYRASTDCEFETDIKPDPHAYKQSM